MDCGSLIVKHDGNIGAVRPYGAGAVATPERGER
jgi:hypothetical protein